MQVQQVVGGCIMVIPTHSSEGPGNTKEATRAQAYPLKGTEGRHTDIPLRSAAFTPDMMSSVAERHELLPTLPPILPPHARLGILAAAGPGHLSIKTLVEYDALLAKHKYVPPKKTESTGNIETYLQAKSDVAKSSESQKANVEELMEENLCEEQLDVIFSHDTPRFLQSGGKRFLRQEEHPRYFEGDISKAKAT
ncbi:LOW QUALITY PROTEIN: hypothetical protein ACHAW5_010243 [Stephanodiscus triporus]|uniref:Uncharacterized protein n=1 Tax=Stephanodiscus triporus TaxID=2934178 RepID=A0ABD3NRR9_9STRA